MPSFIAAVSRELIVIFGLQQEWQPFLHSKSFGNFCEIFKKSASTLFKSSRYWG
jgi:hypothetical protein